MHKPICWQIRDYRMPNQVFQSIALKKKVMWVYLFELILFLTETPHCFWKERVHLLRRVAKWITR